MGNTLSRGQRLELADEAAEATTLSRVDREQLNLLQMPEELIQKIVGKLPDPQISKEQKAENVLNPTSQLASTSHFFYSRIQYSRIVSRLVLETAHGNENKVKQLLKISPAHVRYIIYKADLEDYSHRKFEGENQISAWQYAIFAGDWHMYKMMLRAFYRAAAKAIPTSCFTGKTPDEITELRRHHYLGRLTEEEVQDLWKKLLEQYQEVTERGLNYTINYPELTYIDPRTQQNIIVQQANTVTVNGETCFDLRGPQICPWPHNPQFIPEKHHIYIKIENDCFRYRCISLMGEDVTDEIPTRALNCQLQRFIDFDNEILPFVVPLLKVTAERGHTHPTSLIVALGIYELQFDTWNDDMRKKHWCHVVGQAQRLVPVCVAQYICDPGIFNGEIDFHTPLQRSLEFYHVSQKNRQLWFPLLTESSQLGIHFGIYHGFVIHSMHPFEGYGFTHGTLSSRSSEHIIDNYHALFQLYQTRKKDIQQLGETLLKPINTGPSVFTKTSLYLKSFSF